MRTGRIFIALLLLLSTSFVFGNSVEQQTLSPRKWHVVTQKKIVEGTFKKYYHGQIYLERPNHRIVKFPLYAFSKEDIDFALNRHEYNLAMMERANEEERNFAKSDSVSYSAYCLVPAFLALVMLFLIIKSQRQRLDYFPPKIERLGY